MAIWTTGRLIATSVLGKQPNAFPEDAEEQDKAAIEKLKEEYMQSVYPDFEPEIVSTLQKDYFLPALKVLILTKSSRFFSPSRVSEWKGGELIAECRAKRIYGAFRFPKLVYNMSSKGAVEVTVEPGENELEPVKHTAPDEKCDCGVYGSVNLDEISLYMGDSDTSAIQVEGNRPDGKLTLCIVEPLPDTDVVLCRKGWRAGGAFISEIVDETISVADTSGLLSMAWKREIDIRRLFNADR